MISSMYQLLQEWNDSTDSRQKLQHAYVVSAGVLVVLAGILGLINYEIGQRVLLVAILAIAMFFINAVAWALLQSFVLLKLGAGRATEKLIATRPKPRTTTPKTPPKR